MVKTDELPKPKGDANIQWCIPPPSRRNARLKKLAGGI
jgi:hypothetical protein